MSDGPREPKTDSLRRQNQHVQTTARRTQNTDGTEAVEIQAAYFHGPLPLPALLDGYEKVLPGLADRIVCMAEKEQNHQIALQKIEADEVRVENQREHHRGILGQLLAFILAVVAIGGSFVLLALDKSVAGTISGLASLATLIGMFLYERRDKAQGSASKQAEAETEKVKPPKGQKKGRR